MQAFYTPYVFIPHYLFGAQFTFMPDLLQFERILLPLVFVFVLVLAPFRTLKYILK